MKQFSRYTNVKKVLVGNESKGERKANRRAKGSRNCNKFQLQIIRVPKDVCTRKGLKGVSAI
jgi:hypothetical protein